ncbi:MAG: pyridine nucleotide-disulfide oxidoreductase, partial [Ginsengibacter sp.]
EPITISQISFDKKYPVENHILMLGDAAGLITPLCGNGMSIAFHSAKIAFEKMDLFLQDKISRQKMEIEYSKEWNRNFEKQLRTGRIIQYFFGKEKLTNLFINIIKQFPFLIRQLIKSTHGKEF